MFNVKEEIKTPAYSPADLYLYTGLDLNADWMAYNCTSGAVNRELRWPVSAAVRGRMMEVFRC